MSYRAKQHKVAKDAINERLIQSVKHVLEVAFRCLDKDHADQIIQLHQFLPQCDNYYIIRD